MATFFLLTAGLNIALGYALALYLMQDGQPAVAPQPAPSRPVQKAVVPAAPITPAAQAPVAAPAPPTAIETPPVEPTAPSDTEPVGMGESIEEFKHELLRYREQLATLDQRMRAGTESHDAAAIESCIQDLRSANSQYLEQQEEVGGRLRGQCGTPELELIGRRVTVALEQQAEQVKNANQHLDDVELEENLLVSCQKLLDETARLVDANHAMGETLEEIELQLARRGEMPPQAELDPAERAENLSSRAQFETALTEWWQNDPKREQPLSVGLVDVDHFRELNERHGLQVCDRILRPLAQVIGAVVDGEQMAVRLNGQKFLLLFPALLGREATNLLERVRQQVELIRFEFNDAAIPVTVSCSVAEASPQDTMPTLMGRAESTLQEAKRYGRNRTFLHDQRFPAPVVPPVLPVEARTITI